MFSSLSALVDRPFVIGFVVPTITLIAMISIIFGDVELIKQLSAAITAVDGFQAVFIPLLGLWLGAIALEMCNTTVYRFLEGYIWPLNVNSWKRRSLKSLEKFEDNIKILKEKLEADPENLEIIQKYSVAVRYRATMFPHSKSYVLPTRLGNVFRAFEQYPKAMYGADGIAIWPLLLNVMSEDAKSQISRSRAYVDLLVNFCVLAFLLGVFSLLWGLFQGMVVFIDCTLPKECATVSFKPQTNFFVSGLTLVLLSRLSYEFSISFSVAWGKIVKAAFDTHLSTLAEKLVYSFPSEPGREAEFWTEVTQQVLYSQRSNLPKKLGEEEL